MYLEKGDEMNTLSNRDLLKELTLKLATDEALRDQLLSNEIEQALPTLELGLEAPEVEGYQPCSWTCWITCFITD
jgi:hypothetical protein